VALAAVPTLGSAAANDLPLVDAIKAGDVAHARALIEQRQIDVNAALADGTTRTTSSSRGC
jgi:hypothetical protein